MLRKSVRYPLHSLFLMIRNITYRFAFRQRREESFQGVKILDVVFSFVGRVRNPAIQLAPVVDTTRPHRLEDPDSRTALLALHLIQKTRKKIAYT